MTVAALPTIKIENFEGPFDLLVELARLRKLDLSEISLTEITDSFLKYIEDKKITPELQGDFLVVGSTLLLLKVRHLLPDLSEQEREEVEELTDRVRIYRLYRQQAGWLASRWGRQLLLPAGFWSDGTPALAVHRAAQFPPLQATDLAAHMRSFLASLHLPVRPTAHLTERGWSLQQCLQLFMRRLTRWRRLIFQEAVAGRSRRDAAVSFMAILELARQRHVQLTQDDLFQPIVVQRSDRKQTVAQRARPA